MKSAMLLRHPANFFVVLAFVLRTVVSDSCDGIPWAIEDGGIDCQDFDAAYADGLRFISESMPPWDKINSQTLIDGGVVDASLNLSLEVYKTYPWAATVSKDMFMNDVLPYGIVNEGRSNWRQLMTDNVLPLVANQTTTDLASIALMVNSVMWSSGVLSSKEIVFKSEQTPLIMDPMSTITFGFASCTGVSILYVDALRAVGVPARLVGTPAWNGEYENGNHNWVEVYTGPEDGWSFIEGAPAGGGETLSNPCDKWFCNPARTVNTSFFATSFAADSLTNGVIYPMAWDVNNRAIPGVDRTEYYVDACAAC